MEKKTLYALVAVLALGLGAFLVLRSPEKGQREGPPPRPIAEMKAADVTYVEVVNEKQDKVVLDKKDGTWRMVAPKEHAADQAAAKTLTEGLERLAFADVVTEGVEKHEDLGVAEGKAQRITAKNKDGKLLADFFVGKAVGGFTMVRPAGQNKVWQATGIYPYMVNRDANGWRNHTVVEFAANDAEKLEVDDGASKLILEKEAAKEGQPAAWKIVEATGGAPKTSDALDETQVTGALQALASLRAADFADDKKPEETGLDKPGLTVAATAKGKRYVVSIGKTSGDDVFVRAEGDDTVYTVKKYSLERLAHPPMDYRQKTLAKVKAEDLAGVDITVGAETISIDRGADGKYKAKGRAIDEAKVTPVMSAFENLAGSGFAPNPAPAVTGLAKPAGQVVLRLKDKSTITLRIGAVSADGADYHVAKVGAPDVYLVKKYAVERFLKKPADLAPSGTEKPTAAKK